MTGDTANNAAAANAMMLFVFFMFCFFLVLFLDLAAAHHFLSTVRIGNGRPFLPPIFIEHWAVSDVIAALTSCYRLGPRAELFEPSSPILYQICLGPTPPR